MQATQPSSAPMLARRSLRDRLRKPEDLGTRLRQLLRARTALPDAMLPELIRQHRSPGRARSLAS